MPGAVVGGVVAGFLSSQSRKIVSNRKASVTSSRARSRRERPMMGHEFYGVVLARGAQGTRELAELSIAVGLYGIDGGGVRAGVVERSYCGPGTARVFTCTSSWPRVY